MLIKNSRLTVERYQMDSEEEELRNTADAIRERKKLMMLARRMAPRNHPVMPKNTKAKVKDL